MSKNKRNKNRKKNRRITAPQIGNTLKYVCSDCGAVVSKPGIGFSFFGTEVFDFTSNTPCKKCQNGIMKLSGGTATIIEFEKLVEEYNSLL